MCVSYTSKPTAHHSSLSLTSIFLFIHHLNNLQRYLHGNLNLYMDGIYYVDDCNDNKAVHAIHLKLLTNIPLVLYVHLLCNLCNYIK